MLPFTKGVYDQLAEVGAVVLHGLSIASMHVVCGEPIPLRMHSHWSWVQQQNMDAAPGRMETRSLFLSDIPVSSPCSLLVSGGEDLPDLILNDATISRSPHL